MNEEKIEKRLKAAVEAAVNEMDGIEAVRVKHDLNDPNVFTVILKPGDGA